MFEDAPIVIDLIREGFIDENYTLYVTQFPGGTSASAMNFIIKSVQPNLMDPDYHFGRGSESSETDIEAALAAESRRILNGESVYNREIFDYLLKVDPSKLLQPIRRLVNRAEDNTDFIDLYLAAGNEAGKFISVLGGLWPKIFDYLIGENREGVNTEFVDSAMAGVDPNVTYRVTEYQRELIEQSLPQLSTICKPQPPDQAEKIADTLEQIGIAAPSLGIIAVPLFNELVDRSCYFVSQENLTLILRDPDISLDKIKDDGPSGVYDNVVKRLSDYLGVISANPALVSVREPEKFASVLQDIYEVWPELVKAVAAAANKECIVTRHANVGSAIWPDLIQAKRFQLTISNVLAYIDEYHIDSSLADALESADAIEPDADQSCRLKLAISLLNAPQISPRAKLTLVGSLGLEPESVNSSDLDPQFHGLIPELVRCSFMPDNSDAFVVISEDNESAKRALMTVSTAFPDYMLSINLSANDLRVAVSSSMPDAIKGVAVENLDILGPALVRESAADLIRWSAGSGRSVDSTAIDALTAKSKGSAASATIRLLSTHAETVEFELLRRILDNLGGVYGQITTHGRNRPKVLVVHGIEALLARLKDERIVSKYEFDSKRNLFRVSKHHS